MTKAELIDALSRRTGMPKSKAADTINAIFDPNDGIIVKNAAKGVNIIGFGKFQIKTRKARTGTNPHTGATMNIPASKAVTFSAGKSLRDAVN